MHAPYSQSAFGHFQMRKAATWEILEEICQGLEPTDTQYEQSKISYETVAAWLSVSDNPILKNISLYAHGSSALGTTIRPIGREDFDVDTICRVHNLTEATSPSVLKQIIGNRLREHVLYRTMLEEKKRCWRLNYERAFHLDISPTILNPRCSKGGELVPDKSVKTWKPTNPLGYKALFERRCQLQPRLKFTKSIAADSGIRADIEAFPNRKKRKGILRRIVQLLKRHRDIMFRHVEADIAPISIIITTLAAQSYEFCVASFAFESELDVLIDVIRLMPHFIERPVVHGRTIYSVPNETTQGENFAERWNSEPQRAKAFFDWHARALRDFEYLATLEGVDVITKSLSSTLGDGAIRKVMDSHTESISLARAATRLFVAPAIGLSLSNTAGAVEVPRNTHFGDPPR
ncbi:MULTISPECIES: nucleotidyltransferase [unclassified Bradyrhizobium]|uniref:nucleotidyltransferase domain-containing protein n=1 Tax=unclassified Bradyrhizobium TaxID=2631580 RepID=UPI001FF790DC|nr:MULTISPECIES: nucleotidyltransferase [unclassified Bradyrhizobium]MCK1309869.1 nucleotidyltransferase [Bradyrhizobium sp. 45]MCK1435383.1 nucleotidyltransferase [Bradyrhizobium sp. 15]MCK1614914.1 nucleotidyltransferase [Bradyrhizobium sp. 163]MCK1760224.1 nucleotidyltransferase [Bradyrhizobium sp. 136]